MHPQKLYKLYVLGKDENMEGKKKRKHALGEAEWKSKERRVQMGG